jgi:hypothetical protein
MQLHSLDDAGNRTGICGAEPLARSDPQRPRKATALKKAEGCEWRAPAPTVSNNAAGNALLLLHNITAMLVLSGATT